MSMKYTQIIEVLRKITEGAQPEPWDNSGLQLNAGKEDINKILVCLEVTKEIMAEAKEKNIDLIITHHPLIFRPIAKIDNNDIIGNYITSLIKSSISVYSAHTDFDKLEGGNNTRLCELLGLKNIKSFEEAFSLDPVLKNGDEIIGNLGDLETPMTLLSVIDLVCEKLSIEKIGIRAVGDLNQVVKKIGICTGAGAEYSKQARALGCDLFITGDISYHAAMAAKEENMMLIDAGHFGTEVIFSKNMAQKLEEKCEGNVEIIISEAQKSPFICF